LLAAYTELARLAALANPNNGRLLLLKTKPAKCDTASQPEPVKLFKRSQEEQRYRHHHLQQTHKLANITIWRCR
tara:strand:+ start:364 stop:585 length:222 start_codon:yes stop_codon:yes gene_type:complete